MCQYMLPWSDLEDLQGSQALKETKRSASSAPAVEYNHSQAILLNEAMTIPLFSDDPPIISEHPEVSSGNLVILTGIEETRGTVHDT